MDPEQQHQEPATTTESPPAVDPAVLQAQLNAAEAERQRLAQENQLALGYLQQMTAHLQNQQAQAQRPAATQEEEDDLFVQNPRKFREKVMQDAQQHAQQYVQEQLAPTAQALAVNAIQKNYKDATDDKSMPHFGEWQQEIYQVLAPYGANAAMNYQNWQTAYNLVASRHVPDMVAEQVRNYRPPSEDDDEDEGSGPPMPQSQAPQRIMAPAPISTGRGQAPLRAPARPKVQLTPDERQAAKRTGLTYEEFAHYRDNSSEDVMGFNGRSRI
jgi:hypothetical protein